LTEINEVQTSKQRYQVGVFILVLTTIFIAADYFYLGSGHYRGESFVTLEVTASDTPEYIQSKSKTGYRMKAQQFNCRFWIEGIGLDILRDDKDLRGRVEAIRRGDNLQLTILASEEININSLYYKGLLFGLAIGDKVIFSAKDIQSLSDKGREKRLWIACTIWVTIFFGLVIGLLTKR